MHLAWYVVLMPKGGKSVAFNIEKTKNKKQKTKNKKKNKNQQQQQKRKKEKSVCQIKL